jgi:hypothetical protein
VRPTYVPTVNKVAAHVGAHVALEAAAGSTALKYAIRARTGMAMSTSAKIFGTATTAALLYTGFEATNAMREEYKACME